MGGIEIANKIQTPPTQEIKKKETLDQILQSKITDQNTINKIKPILEDIQKNFSQSINGYIKMLDELELSTLGDTNENDKKKIIEDIDIFLNKNKTPEIVNTIEEEEKNKDEVKENKDEVKERVEIKDTFLESWKATKASYDKLDEKDKITDEKLHQEKANIPQIVIDAIKKKTEGTDLQADEFLKFYLIGENKDNQAKPQYKDFMKNYKELKKELEIPEVMSLQEATKPQNMDRIIDNNKSLRTFTETSERFKNITKVTLPESKDFEKEFNLYVKLIPDEKIRKNIEENKELIKEYKGILETDQEDARDLEGQKAYDEYTNAINTVKDALQEGTQKMAKQRVLGSCSTGLAKYFDTTTLAPSGGRMKQEHFIADLDTNTQDGFRILKGTQQNEENDDILYINGNINGNTIGFYYNLNNIDAQLQSDDFLHFNSETETFGFGMDGGGKNKLGIKLPTIGMLSTEAQAVIDSEFATQLQKAGNMEEFETSLKDKISLQLLKNYGQETIVKTRVERDIEKNITIQTAQNMFFPDVVITELNRDKIIDKTTERKPRKIMEIRDKSTENMRSDQLRTLRGLIQRLDPLISKENHPNLESKWKNILSNMGKERSAVTYAQDRGKYLLKFFKKFSHADKIDLKNLEIFIISLEKSESIGENMNKFSPEFQIADYESDDKNEADKLLENIA